MESYANLLAGDIEFEKGTIGRAVMEEAADVWGHTAGENGREVCKRKARMRAIVRVERQ